ncbi:uracil DNA glycosylase superfamily protein [Haloferax elongans ATCC BAA-1513]|uniref:Uracil DNA glycosylase superfamily protein n=1 Tax=Haloferax elongans ATCC BAA-1513 TaxID=1230453 RepID=M0HW73_HALEO|nr:uracil-DNA glycosylase [Haloferax elongans]ELZ87369.1 uracil DNA glycosylase superfamily protein [Haloferax elongans ATCC BAA-1513]
MADPEFPAPENKLVVESDCTRCPALVECRNRISWGVGPSDATVVVVGEAPGAGNPDADRWQGGNWTGMSYTAQHSGRRIRETMATVGYDEDVFYTNAVKCFPSDGEGSNRAPSAAEKDNCLDHLVTELETIDPDVVIPTGRHATESVFSLDDRTLGGFLETVLEPVESVRFGYTIVPLLHPAYRDVWLSRVGYELAEYFDELARLLP